jgi:hypothetical protein
MHTDKPPIRAHPCFIRGQLRKMGSAHREATTRGPGTAGQASSDTRRGGRRASLPLSERARIEVYLPDVPRATYQDLLAAFGLTLLAAQIGRPKGPTYVSPGRSPGSGCHTHGAALKGRHRRSTARLISPRWGSLDWLCSINPGLSPWAVVGRRFAAAMECRSYLSFAT